MGRKKVHKKFSSSTENPFDIKTNRNKFPVLGQKVKGVKGRPGVSHSIGNSRRREAFHKKRLDSLKSNKFIDKRLLNSSQTYDDPATARLVEERKKKFKKSIFNLNDDEILTHRGIPLLSGNCLNYTIDDSDDDIPLDSQFVKQAHFGGSSRDSTPKSRKEVIDEIIMESKKRKNDRKLANEKNAELIEKLDQEWKERHVSLPLLKDNKQIDLPAKNDPFDVILKELKFEKRATISSRLKSPEEIAREEREKQKKLEEERDKRMVNPMHRKNLLKHVSADSLDYVFESEFEHSEYRDAVHADEHCEDDSGKETSDDSENEIEDNSTMGSIQNKAASVVTDSCKIPDSLDEFCNIIKHQNEEIDIIVENILNKFIKNKTKKNVLKLERFFTILIQYIMREGGKPEKALDILDTIMPHFYTLAEISPINTGKSIIAFMDEEQEIFQPSKRKKFKRNFPRFHCLVLFEISSNIYSVSDFIHPVVTPAIIFMCDILSSSFAVSFQNVFTRLHICIIIYDCVSYSKRYVPEVIMFCIKTLELAVNSNEDFNLCIHEIVSVQKKSKISFFKILSEKICDDTVKASILSKVIELMHKFALLYTYLPSFKEIFLPVLNICKKIPIASCPDYLKEEITKFISFVESVKKTYVPLTFPENKPVPLKMFTPSYDSKFTKKKDDIQKKRKLIKQVGQKIKKEEKGMHREVRRYNQVVAAEKLKEKLEADEERKRKVKQLYQELAMQEGEYKKFVKKK